jgi:hypothetical protein
MKIRGTVVINCAFHVWGCIRKCMYSQKVSYSTGCETARQPCTSENLAFTSNNPSPISKCAPVRIPHHALRRLFQFT